MKYPPPSTSFLPLPSLTPYYFTNLSKYVNVRHDEPTCPPNIKKASKMQNRAPACAKSSHPRNEFQIPHPKCMENAALGVDARAGTSKTGREVIPMVAGAARIVEATWLTRLSFWCKKQAPKCRRRGTSPGKKWGTGFWSHTLRKPRSETVHNWGQASLKSKVDSWV